MALDASIVELGLSRKDIVGISREDIEKSKKGVEEFRKVYETAGKELQHLLVGTTFGQSLQAMFLGLKPASMPDSDTQPDSDVQLALVKECLSDKFDFEEDFVFDRQQVEAKIRHHPEVFGELKENEDISLIIKKLSTAITPEDRKKAVIKLGLILGYPYGAVLSYVSHQEDYDRFIHYCYWDSLEDLPLEDRLIIRGYVFGKLGGHSSETSNQLKDQNEAKIREILERKFPDMSKEGKDYVVTARIVDTHGFSYIVGNPTQQNKEFLLRVQTIWEVSGMNSYLASIQQPPADFFQTLKRALFTP